MESRSSATPEFGARQNDVADKCKLKSRSIGPGFFIHLRRIIPPDIHPRPVFG